MINELISRLLIMSYGILYPAYASYKVVHSRDLDECENWLIYWIVFAFFTCIETFTDVFIFWFPLYYVSKMVLVFWLVPSPFTKGSLLYHKCVHPMLQRHEPEIDEFLTQVKVQGYSTVIKLATKGFNYAAEIIKQTAKGTFSMTTVAQEMAEEEPLHEAGAARTRGRPVGRVAPRRAGSGATAKRVSRVFVVGPTGTATEEMRAIGRLHKPIPEVDVND